MIVCFRVLVNHCVIKRLCPAHLPAGLFFAIISHMNSLKKEIPYFISASGARHRSVKDVLTDEIVQSDLIATDRVFQSIQELEKGKGKKFTDINDLFDDLRI